MYDGDVMFNVCKKFLPNISTLLAKLYHVSSKQTKQIAVSMYFFRDI